MSTDVALTIAGSDPSGGAGIQADLKTFQQHEVYGMAVISLLTVQNTQTVQDVHLLPAHFVVSQLDAVLADIPPQAAKTGALGTPEVIELVAERARSFAFPLVVDPVMVSKHGAALAAPETVLSFRESLLPQAFLVTPNIPEAEALSGVKIRNLEDAKSAARILRQCGTPHVLMKGGHLVGPPIDLFYSDDQFYELADERLPTKHGTGCVLSAAITARLARREPVLDAVLAAKEFIRRAIRAAPLLGQGTGPLGLMGECIRNCRN